MRAARSSRDAGKRREVKKMLLQTCCTQQKPWQQYFPAVPGFVGSMHYDNHHAKRFFGEFHVKFSHDLSWVKEGWPVLCTLSALQNKASEETWQLAMNVYKPILESLFLSWDKRYIKGQVWVIKEQFANHLPSSITARSFIRQAQSQAFRDASWKYHF